jgi:hypothetical protein
MLINKEMPVGWLPGASRDQIKSIRDKLFDSAFADIEVIDFSENTQKYLDDN